MLARVVIFRRTLRRSSLLPSRKSLPLNSFADPHPLSPVPSILYKRHGGRGTKPLRRSDAQFASRMDLSPLECAVADKHRVLPVFSRDCPASSSLESTLMSILVSVDSKWFTVILSPLESALTKNPRGRVLPAFQRANVSILRRAVFKSLPPYFVTSLRPYLVTSSVLPVPLQPDALGATMSEGAGILHAPGKQLCSPRCLRLERGHREQSDKVPGHPGSVGVASRAWVQRSRVGPQQGGPNSSSVQDGKCFTSSGKDADFPSGKDGEN